MKLAVLSCVAVGLALAGCGNDGDATSPEGSARSAASAASAASTASSDGGTAGGMPPHGSSPGGMATDDATDGSTDGAVDGSAASLVLDSTTLAPAYVDVDVEPGLGTDGFVGARDDVEVWRCELDGDHWVASGFVTNPTEKGAAYRIYVAFNPVGAVVARGLVQVDLLIPHGETHPWEAIAWITDPGLECVLRVERISG